MRIGFAGLLAILFIGLKLTNVIAWSWLWVLSPIWIAFALWLVLWLVLVVIAAIGVLAETPSDRMLRQLKKKYH